jgi:hypothetical protein
MKRLIILYVSAVLRIYRLVTGFTIKVGIVDTGCLTERPWSGPFERHVSNPMFTLHVSPDRMTGRDDPTIFLSRLDEQPLANQGPGLSDKHLGHGLGARTFSFLAAGAD